MTSALDLKKVQAAVSKHVGIVPKNRGGGNNAKVWVKTASSATIIVFWVYSVMLCGGSVKCGGLYCGVACNLVFL